MWLFHPYSSFKRPVSGYGYGVILESTSCHYLHCTLCNAMHNWQCKKEKKRKEKERKIRKREINRGNANVCVRYYGVYKWYKLRRHLLVV